MVWPDGATEWDEVMKSHSAKWSKENHRLIDTHDNDSDSDQQEESKRYRLYREPFSTVLYHWVPIDRDRC